MIVSFSVSVSGVGEKGAGAAGGSEESDRYGSVSHAVAAAVRVVRESGLPHQTSSMFTEIEGEWDEVMGVVKQCVDAVAPYGARISLVLKADIRATRPAGKDDVGEIDGKLARVEQALTETEQHG